jgi:CTP:molybdopterin cytidylyltransferase MocA
LKTMTTKLREEIQRRLQYLKEQHSRQQQTHPILNSDDAAVKLARLQGNIAGLEWVLREDELNH